jgi:sugar porter (SP) family MFS transporter
MPTTERTMLRTGDGKNRQKYETIDSHRKEDGRHNDDGPIVDDTSSSTSWEGLPDDDEEQYVGRSGGRNASSLRRLVMVAAATAATLGYDVGIMAAAIQPLTSTMNLNGVQKEVAMGSLNFIAALGALLGGRIANDHGRKYTVKVCCWIFVVGTVLMAAAPEYWTFLAGRLVTGMGVGVSFVAAPVYLAEVAPTDMRGKLNTVFDVAINAGILLGYVLGFLVQLIPNLDDHWRWRIMLGLGLLLPLFVLWNLVHLPESPRWLVMVDKSDEAAEVLQDIAGGEESPHEIQKMISSMEEQVQEEAMEAGPDGQMSIRSEGSVGQLSPLQAVFQCRLSSGMRLAIAVGFWQQITGTEAVLYYSADFLQNAGLGSPTERLFGNCFVGLCKLIPELIAMHYVDSLGRRPLMLTSAVSLVMSTALISTAFYLEWSPLIVVISLCAIMASFSIGLGPFSFLVASESLGLSERATGMTLCAAVNRCTSGTVALTAVSMYQALGSSGLFAVYGLVGVMSLPFYFTTIPETAGQTLEEIAAKNKAANNTLKEESSVELELGHSEESSGRYSDEASDKAAKDKVTEGSFA